MNKKVTHKDNTNKVGNTIFTLEAAIEVHSHIGSVNYQYHDAFWFFWSRNFSRYKLTIHDTEGFDQCKSDCDSCPNDTPLFAFQPITTGDVHKIITSLPSNKAPGCDR